MAKIAVMGAYDSIYGFAALGLETFPVQAHDEAKALLEEYGAERGGKIRFAEAFQICEYGSPMTEELRNVFLSL